MSKTLYYFVQFSCFKEIKKHVTIHRFKVCVVLMNVESYFNPIRPLFGKIILKERILTYIKVLIIFVFTL